MKTRKTNKKGISLIVLVITIIVMIILAAAVILAISNNNIVGKANEAAEQTNLRNVQSLVTLAWADAYAGGARNVDTLKTAVDTAILNAKVDTTKYEITVTDKGVSVKLKETTTPPATPEEPDEPTKLLKPTVTISGDTLTITDNTENGSNTASFEVYVGEEKKGTITASSTTTFDMASLELAAGTYSVTVKSVAADGSGIEASEASTAVEYIVQEVASVPEAWQAYVSELTAERVPIPKGFVKSPYTNEDEIAEGLVIYALTETEITNKVTDITTIDANQQASLESRNQFVWVPVNKTTFATSNTQFKRTDYTNNPSKIVTDSVGTDNKYWELILTTTNMPSETQGTSFVSPATLLEATAMYESVAEYGGFYIARYEAGGSQMSGNFGRGTLSITMGKYPYNAVKWGTDMANEVLTNDTETGTDGAVTLARGMYPSSNTNYGVVSTLTYGVQWDRTLDWIKSIKGYNIDLTSSSENGNYSDTTLSASAFNTNAKYATATYNSSTTGVYDIGEWTLGTSFASRGSGEKYIMTTGALKKANLCNIYDMAGNVLEWTMEGYSTSDRIYRGGSFAFTGLTYSVAIRNSHNVPTRINSGYGFRPALYIKK